MLHSGFNFMKCIVIVQLASIADVLFAVEIISWARRCPPAQLILDHSIAHNER